MRSVSKETCFLKDFDSELPEGQLCRLRDIIELYLDCSVDKKAQKIISMFTSKYLSQRYANICEMVLG